jgi:Kef-type K+ transport system membrane component KefB
VATSVAVTASVISEIGMIGTPVAYAIVGAAVVDDVLGMVVLAVSRGMTDGSLDAAGISLLLVGAVVFVVVGAWVGSNFLTRFVFMVQVSGYRSSMRSSLRRYRYPRSSAPSSLERSSPGRLSGTAS